MKKATSKRRKSIKKIKPLQRGSHAPSSLFHGDLQQVVCKGGTKVQGYVLLAFLKRAAEEKIHLPDLPVQSLPLSLPLAFFQSLFQSRAALGSIGKTPELLSIRHHGENFFTHLQFSPFFFFPLLTRSLFFFFFLSFFFFSSFCRQSSSAPPSHSGQ